MTDSEFHALAEQTLDQIEVTLETVFQSTDLDIETTRNGNVLTVSFENGSKIIINGQAAVQEMWVAARENGFHYKRSEGLWRDTRDGSELFASISRHASLQSGQTIVITPPSR